MDGRGYDQPWGRPQNDGPALRALVLSRFALLLLEDGHINIVRELLYSDRGRPNSPIKIDLEYVAQKWSNPSFDLWEEVLGDHFYTRMTQRAALEIGAKLARKMADPEAANWYEQQVRSIDSVIDEHFSNQKSIIEITVNRSGGLDYKHSGLDTAVILACLHTNQMIGSDWLAGTAFHIERSFQSIYNVNKYASNLGTAIGRYPEDRYYNGNPWFLTTHAFAEYYYRLIDHHLNEESIQVTPVNFSFYRRVLGQASGKKKKGDGKKSALKLEVGELDKDSALYREILVGLFHKADQFLKRSKYHTGSGHQMDEQIDRNRGYMLSARDLTWSYASFLTAYWSREAVRDRLEW